jgi:putative oxidoreductase
MAGIGCNVGRLHVQRLFSIFPNGWPGGGLLVLRLAASGFLLTQGAAKFLPATRSDGITPAVVGIVGGLLMVIGLWTPVGCLLAAVAESWLVIIGGIAVQPAILLISMGAALAMLGPGAWSIDSVLYGRQRLDITE